MGRYDVHEDPRSKTRYLSVDVHGTDLMADPFLNKGTCFSADERERFGLRGLLPPGVATEAEQLARVYANFLEAGSDVQRYVFLTALQDRNETLFYRLLQSHIEEMAPVVYTPTVGKACERFSHLYRRPRGVYVTPEDRGRIREILERAPVDDCRVIVVTDNEAILGLGDLGAGGMGISIGKLTLYTAGAGVHPASCLPIDLDVGTENEALLSDPLYLGYPERRLRGEAYFELLDEFVDAVTAVFPRALVQWEDFANDNAFAILARYRDRVLSFNDDVQGTGAVVVAGIHAALERAGRSLKDERIVFFGVGASGGGCALAVRQALREAGVADAELGSRVLCIDSKGLLLRDRPGLSGHKAELAVDPAVARGWPTDGPYDLQACVRHYRPTVLLGTSGRTGAFTEEVVRAMLEGCGRPVVFPLSNPTSKAEARPDDLLRWTDGKAMVAAGSPFPPVQIGGETWEIGQANNVLAFPGIGLGAIAVEARMLPDEAFLVAARTLAEVHRTSGHPGDPLFPRLTHLREVSRTIAVAVGRHLVAVGAAPPRDDADVEVRVDALTWQPEYLPYRQA